MNWATKKQPFRSINIKAFADSFGASKEEVSRFCGDLIQVSDFKYRVCSHQNREDIFLDILTKFDNKDFSVSGPHRKTDWSKGWGEILHHFNHSNGELSVLVPKDIRGDRPLRYNGDYIIANSNSFEYDFRVVFKKWLYNKYFKTYKCIYEFGCGTGHNLVNLATMYPNKAFFGMDWVRESQRILQAISQKHELKIRGYNFDIFDPDYRLDIERNSLVYTSGALEQLGPNHTAFINYLLTKRPSLCVNLEPIAEYYNKDCLFDYVALKYHETRNYLSGYLTRLRELEKEKLIKIIASKRLGFGSLYHEGYTYIVWKIL
jgi:hypothetical protein